MSSTSDDLFPGFATHRIATTAAEIHVRVGGSGPPLLLLHGYPQTHACWHKVTPTLTRHFMCVAPDLRGYGESKGPSADHGHLAYSKRAMARDFVEVMQKLGHERFAVMSHDRGGRVGYRLALDHPERIDRLVTLDIVTTLDAWTDMNMDNAVGRFHWPFLARPAPFPETMIGHDPVFFLEYLLAQWTSTKDLSAFDPRALDHYRRSFARPEVIHASCEDYRAGATCDPEIDAADRAAGRVIACPMLALWGASRKHGFVNKPLETWRPWCPHVVGMPIESGHFLPEEAPDATLAEALPFLLADRNPV
ncbi:MAG: alpha/beta hydrolase [Hyphomicrobiaceae bacterium]|nr:alpha/beta hydrolase [Hyphomicrobiaceae bacterium]